MKAMHTNRTTLFSKCPIPVNTNCIFITVLITIGLFIGIGLGLFVRVLTRSLVDKLISVYKNLCFILLLGLDLCLDHV